MDGGHPGRLGSGLSVRLVHTDEVARFNALLDEHHWLGHHLFGRVLRYVATYDGEWVALIGFGSAALSVAGRDRFIGWSAATKRRHLRYVANNQRYLVLPGERRENLASAVLSRTLRRLSQDMVQAHGVPVLLVETFTDPARHLGTCYKAANFVSVGETQGYARKNGSWAHHGEVKRCWVYPLHRRATEVLAAPFDHPVLVMSDKEGADVVDLNAVVIEGRGGLYERLQEITDHRKPRGIRHQLASVLLVCAAAMLSGCHNPTEIAEWARSLDDDLLLRLHTRRSPGTGRIVAPSLSTIQRVLWAVDREQLDRVVADAVASKLDVRRTHVEEGAEEPETTTTSEDSDPDEDDGPPAAPLRAIAVDTKSLRGAIQDDGRAVHLLAALTHEERVVIAQAEVDHKENEIVAFRPMLEHLTLAGRVVTADAMHTQREHARFLVEGKSAAYLFFVKENQPTLYDAIATLDEDRWSGPVTETAKGHGRLETRTIWVATGSGLHDFPHLSQVVRIMREVDDAKTKTARSTETAYAVTSLTTRKATRRQLLSAARGHWSIENGLHWVRDATMREDHSKVRSGSAPRALAAMRNLAISVLRLAGATNIARALRSVSRRPESALTLLGL